MLGRIVKNILGVIERLFIGNGSRTGLYVINYHGTPENLIPNFARHLSYYKKHFEIISPLTFETLINQEELDAKKPFLLLTFDDGMKNNRHVIEMLEENNLRAYFFVVPAFIDAENPQHYLASVIRPGYTNKLEKAAEDFMPLSWQMILQARQKGHGIGSHSFTHTMLASDDEKKSEYEIRASKQMIENLLGQGINAFCSINNTDISVGKLQDNMIRANYRMHFTTYYGNNTPLPDPYRIQRINIEAYWHMNEVRFALGRIRKSILKK